MAESKKVIHSKKVISEQGAVMKVTSIKLTARGNNMLRANTKRGITSRSDERQDEERHRAVPA